MIPDKTNEILMKPQPEELRVPVINLANLPATYGDPRERSNINDGNDSPVYGPPKTLRPVLIPDLTKKSYYLSPATEVPSLFKPNELPPIHQPPTRLAVRSNVEQANQGTDDARPLTKVITPTKLKLGNIRPPPLPWRYHHRERKSTWTKDSVVEESSWVDVLQRDIKSSADQSGQMFTLISRPVPSLKPVKRPLYDPASPPKPQYDMI